MAKFVIRALSSFLLVGVGAACTAETGPTPAPVGTARAAAAGDFAALDVAQICALTANCCSAGGFLHDLAECTNIFNNVKGISGELEGVTTPIVTGPGVLYDDAAATQCLAGIAGLGCGTIGAAGYRAMLQSCFDVYTGTLPTGSACASTVQCNPGAYCDPATGQCAALKAAGALCASSEECAYRGAGGACDDGVCIGARLDGDSCASGLECASGLCDGVCTQATATPFTANMCSQLSGGATHAPPYFEGQLRRPGLPPTTIYASYGGWTGAASTNSGRYRAVGSKGTSSIQILFGSTATGAVVNGSQLAGPIQVQANASGGCWGLAGGVGSSVAHWNPTTRVLEATVTGSLIPCVGNGPGAMLEGVRFSLVLPP
ncbi:MAG TPA: hypothetical protein PLR99_04800 [Polyangiaceae bacterium]|nr:hypothetical protein [Polyangiaceae bacterium]